jgi:hypothetical protein
VAIDTQPVLVTCFGGGTSGSSVPATAGGGNYANLGTADGMLFDAVSIGSGQAMTYDNTTAHSGTLSCKLVSTANAACFGEWEGSGLLVNVAAQTWYRLYLYQTAWPAAVHAVAGLYVSGTRCADVVVNTNGTLSVRNTSGSVIVTTTNTVPNSAWYRIEGYVTSNASTGQVELKLFTSPDSATATETQTSGANQDTAGGNINQVRFGLSAASATTITWWMDDVAVSVAGYIGPGAIVQTMACGAPTATGFTVISKPVSGTSLRLKIATNSGLTQNVQYVAAVTPDQYGYTRHTVTGLNPFTRYYCQLLDTPTGGSEFAVGNVGQCKTLQTAGVPQSFTFAVASCVNTADETPGPDTALNDWIAWQPDLAVFTGDFGYQNPTFTDQPSQIGTWENQVWFYGMEPITRQAWGYYCRSNHDSTTDASYCDSDNLWTAANLLAAQEIWPQGALGDTVNNPVHGLFQTWVQGRVRFILLDIRNIDRSPGTATDNSSKTMLGPTQLPWLYAQLAQPEPVKIIITDTQWLGSTVPSLGQDPELGKWWSYQTERAAVVNQMIATWSQMKNVLLIHGDFHGVAEALPWENPTGGFPVFCAAPMRQTGASTNNPGTFDRYYNNSGGECRQYGRVTVTDSGQTISVQFQGWDAVNQVAQVEQTFTANVACGYRQLAGVL